ncbi:MAG: A/G-specific adenine glycosylase [Planctomycetes bacterium]|nr:A/G-specific adenine glycosylase [Planctomycetota bacterium]MCB9903069.1 A/G-specific adenine glycosylase [Planctomycetota bacterium]
MPHAIPEGALLRRADLLEWFAAHRRELPWRADRDPYRVWISEAMLQQTRVEAARDHFERFVRALPTVRDLAAASEDEVLALWSGLGYYSRARKLREAAQVIVCEHGGAFPRELASALALPGVGPYTAGAVLSIAHGEPVPLVDGNVERVLCRWFGWTGNPKQGALKRALWDAAARLVEGLPDPGAWNQAVMELGALVCTPRTPRCDDCPLAPDCVARATGRTAELPELPRRREAILVELEIALCRKPGAWLLERRPAGGRMAGLHEFPTRELAVREGEERLYPARFASSTLRVEGEVGAVRHTITHHKIEARALTADAGPLEPDGPLRWVPDAELESLGLTGMTRKVLRADFARALC